MAGAAWEEAEVAYRDSPFLHVGMG
jgi:hypothetical protein